MDFALVRKATIPICSFTRGHRDNLQVKLPNQAHRQYKYTFLSISRGCRPGGTNGISITEVGTWASSLPLQSWPMAAFSRCSVNSCCIFQHLGLKRKLSMTTMSTTLKLETGHKYTDWQEPKWLWNQVSRPFQSHPNILRELNNGTMCLAHGDHSSFLRWT